MRDCEALWELGDDKTKFLKHGVFQPAVNVLGEKYLTTCILPPHPLLMERAEIYFYAFGPCFQRDTG